MKHIVIILITILILKQAQGSLNKKLIKLIDHNQYVSIFRGNAPINEKGQFQYDELRQILEGMTKDFARNYTHRIYLVSLLNQLSSAQTKQKYILEHLFNQQRTNPDEYSVNRVYNRYKSHAVMGVYVSPSLLPAPIRNMAAKYYKYVNYDDLQSLFSYIKLLMTYRYETFFYIFSHDGLDRTGYVLGAYKMKYLNATLKQVMQQNMELIKGHRTSMHFNCYYALQWYCLNLQRSSDECLVGQNANSLQKYEL